VFAVVAGGVDDLRDEVVARTAHEGILTAMLTFAFDHVELTPKKAFADQLLHVIEESGRPHQLLR
jgi:hypothetical protein